MWTHRSGFRPALVLALALWGNASAADPSCAPAALAGCNIGMPLDTVVRHFPTATVEVHDGLQVLSASVKDPLPGVGLGEGNLEVTFDQSSTVSEIWFETKPAPPERDILTSVKRIWGEADEEAHYDFVGKGVTNMSWAPCSRVSRKLNVVTKGTPQVTIIHVGLVRELK